MEIRLRYGDRTLTEYTYVKLTLKDEEITQMEGLIDAYHAELKDQARKAGTDPESVARPTVQATIYWLNNAERNSERRWYYKKYSPQVTTDSGDEYPLVEHASVADGMIERNTYRDPADDLVEDIIRRANADALWEAVAKLEPQQQDLIRALFTEGIPASEIARREGVSPAAITARKKKIIARLKVALEGRIQW